MGLLKRIARELDLLPLLLTDCDGGGGSITGHVVFGSRRYSSGYKVALPHCIPLDFSIRTYLRFGGDAKLIEDATPDSARLAKTMLARLDKRRLNRHAFTVGLCGKAEMLGMMSLYRRMEQAKTHSLSLGALTTIRWRRGEQMLKEMIKEALELVHGRYWAMEFDCRNRGEGKQGDLTRPRYLLALEEHYADYAGEAHTLIRSRPDLNAETLRALFEEKYRQRWRPFQEMQRLRLDRHSTFSALVSEALEGDSGDAADGGAVDGAAEIGLNDAADEEKKSSEDESGYESLGEMLAPVPTHGEWAQKDSEDEVEDDDFAWRATYYQDSAKAPLS